MFPSLTAHCPRAHQALKGRLRAAVQGHSLLKKKADALNLRFRAILREIKSVPIFVEP